MKILGAVYKTDYVTAKTNSLICEIIKKMTGNLPAIMGQIQLTAAERKGLQKVELDMKVTA